MPPDLPILPRVTFALPDGTGAGHGMLLQYSRNGISFVTERVLTDGQDLIVTLCSEQGQDVRGLHPQEARVVRAVRENERTVVDALFELQDTTGKPDRRQHTRYLVELEGWYAHNEDGPRQACVVRDLSKTGVRFETTSHLRPEKTVVLGVRAKRPEESQIVRLLVEVQRSDHIGHGMYDNGALIVKRLPPEAMPTPKPLPEM